MIIGIGVDVVDLARFERATTRTPGVLTRLFAESEQWEGDTKRSLNSMAARFAAKEAVIKAIGDSTGVRWHDMAVVSDGLRNPSIEVYNSLAQIVAARGISAIHLSMSHDAGVAIAYVIAEGSGVA
ncbi:holo-ACP synthase [Glaciihabitans sp. INWT7]|uniref:holo-ACP synthase n=1 Tax=Glaciihabitans sp. INWT7 TaxID=2596912 RepID=UPI00162939F2|nr:holo-ACP synthase [Glaciihabitans sp. INWT7]QNE47910.1 holo-ACP synthase [Glaciihabitans sp. INWT7]